MPKFVNSKKKGTHDYRGQRGWAVGPTAGSDGSEMHQLHRRLAMQPAGMHKYTCRTAKHVLTASAG